jgi:syntaxin-binding protein 1
MQSLATGLDEENKTPRNLADQVVRLLDDDAITQPDRLRLIIQYILYRRGLLSSDIQKLLAHAQLHSQEGEIIHNLDLLGAQVSRSLREARPVAPSLFARGQATPPDEDSSLSRFVPAVKSMLEAYVQGTLDHARFPFTKPHLDSGETVVGQGNVSQASLRSAKPTWARTRSSAAEPRQRIMVYVAGGATYSESRACYEASEQFSKDIFLVTSHMLTPSLYLRQLGDLSVDKRLLNLPAEQPRPKAPAYLFEKDPSPQRQEPRVAAHLDRLEKEPSRGSTPGRVGNPPPNSLLPSTGNKPVKKDKDKDVEKKKKLHFFGSKK